MHLLWVPVSLLASFFGVFTKIWQQKNVTGHHVRFAAFTSYLIAVADVAIVSMIIKGGWLTILTSGTGGALGVVLAMTLHDKLFKK